MLSSFTELEAEIRILTDFNERLRWELAERQTEYQHLVRRYEIIVFRQHLDEMNIVNQISISDMEEI